MKQAFLLAAGLGTRLRPLTDHMSKVMVPISADGMPLLEHLIRQLKEQGVRRFVVNLHYKGEQIMAHFGDGARLGVEIRYSDESAGLLDTAGALRHAAHLLDEEFLLVYGDQLHNYDFSPLLRRHHETGALATVTLKRSDLPGNGDLAEIEPGSSGRIKRWFGRPHGITEFSENLYLNTGLDVLSRRILDEIPEGRPVSLDREVLPRLVAEGAPIVGLPGELEILDIGTPEKYEFAKQWYTRWQDARPRVNKALLLDRDGTLIRALPRGEYLTKASQMELLPGVEELLARAQELGYRLLVVTNQPQVARGLLTQTELDALHDDLARRLGRRIDVFYACPHVDADGCGCRKPAAGMLLQAAREFALDPAQCWMVGDSFRDVQAAQAFGCRSAFLRNEFNAEEETRVQPTVTLERLTELLPHLDTAV